MDEEKGITVWINPVVIVSTVKGALFSARHFGDQAIKLNGLYKDILRTLRDTGSIWQLEQTKINVKSEYRKSVYKKQTVSVHLRGKTWT